AVARSGGRSFASVLKRFWVRQWWRVSAALRAVAYSCAGLRLGHGHVLPTHVHVDAAAIRVRCGLEHRNCAALVGSGAGDAIGNGAVSCLVVEQIANPERILAQNRK